MTDVEKILQPLFAVSGPGLEMFNFIAYSLMLGSLFDKLEHFMMGN